jgi:hypothetical protein
MGRKSSVRLDTNDAFSGMKFTLVSGGSCSLSEGIGEGYGIVLLYRGS